MMVIQQGASPTRLMEMLGDRFGASEAVANSSVSLHAWRVQTSGRSPDLELLPMLLHIIPKRVMLLHLLVRMWPEEDRYITVVSD